jgi:hypothetical protein
VGTRPDRRLTCRRSAMVTSDGASATSRALRWTTTPIFPPVSTTSAYLLDHAATHRPPPACGRYIECGGCRRLPVRRSAQTEQPLAERAHILTDKPCPWPRYRLFPNVERNRNAYRVRKGMVSDVSASTPEITSCALSSGGQGTFQGARTELTAAARAQSATPTERGTAWQLPAARREPCSPARISSRVRQLTISRTQHAEFVAPHSSSPQWLCGCASRTGASGLERARACALAKRPKAGPIATRHSAGIPRRNPAPRTNY